MELSDAARAANLRACTLPAREMSPEEARLSRMYHSGILTLDEYRAALARLD